MGLDRSLTCKVEYYAMQTIEEKMMRPKRYAGSRGIDFRTFYMYLAEGTFPSYKVKGIVLVDVAECDAIIKSGRRLADVGLTKATKAK